MSGPRGVSGPGGVSGPRRVSAKGVSGPVSGPGGCGIPACTEADTPPPPWTESQTPVKTLPWPNFVAAGKKNRGAKERVINSLRTSQKVKFFRFF